MLYRTQDEFIKRMWWTITFHVDCTLECVIDGKNHVGVEHGGTWMVYERPIGYGGKKNEVSCFTALPQREYTFGVFGVDNDSTKLF